MIERIVCPVDFSDASCHAADYAVKLAAELHASVVFVTVLDVGDLRVAMKAGLHGFDTDEEMRREVREWIDEQYAKVERDSGSVTTSRDVRRGIPDQEILEAIREHKADLVVMGSSGIAHRFPIGSSTEYLLRHSDVPVLVLR